jgi:spore germination protein GerM
MKFLPSFLIAALLISGCAKKSTTTTTIDSTGGVVEIPNNSTSEEPSGDPGYTDPGPSQSDGSVPGTGPNDNPVGNPPDGNPPAGNPPKQPPSNPSGNITVSSPQNGDYVNANGFTITGLARTFENNVVYRVTDQATKKVLASGFGTATGEMGKFSPYTINVKPSKVAGVQYPTRALIEVFENSAKDGSEINKVQVPVRMGVGADEPNAIEVFFSNAKKGSSNNCDLVFSLPRSIPQTQALATIALQRMLGGPTAEERAQGYASQIPAGTRLNKVTVAGGVARADFSSELSTAAGACRVTAIRAQIERTLRQFSTVKSVVITVNGKGDALQP